MMRNRQGFTLIELLVVVGIIGTLVGILMPSFVAVTDLAREADCLNNLSLISKAANQYMVVHNGLLPLNDN